ncbi:MAG: hypothetical protein RBG13Loki_0630 [Promethearchaeota archaeon CR_4]|nr:MAG: hypothetical protein RBG13Loki_0630 [Candidatus Lokiarchaeota archaeon CR_4]
MAVPIDLTPTLIIVLGIVGVGVALITSMVGLGGGIIFVPVLLLFFQFPAKNAIPISLLAMTGNTISCSIAYIRQKRVNYKLALLYDVMDPVGVYVGALLMTILSENIIIGSVAGIIFILGFSLIRKARSNQITESTPHDSSFKNGQHNSCTSDQVTGEPNNQNQSTSSPTKDVKIKKLPVILVSSFGSGFVSGLAGLGGGITDTTSMILLGVPPYIAAPTSEFAMAFTNIIAVIAHTLMGNMVWEAAVPLMFGAVIGAQIGAHLSKRVKNHVLIYILVGFAWFAAIRLIFSITIGI